MSKATQCASRLLLALLVSVLFCLSVAGCGVAGKPGPSSSISSGATARVKTGTIITGATPGQYLRGDGDADNPGDTDGNGDVDPGEDTDEDYPVPESYKFPDADDQVTLAYGHAPSNLQRGAITSVLKHYYSAISAGDGALACSLLVPAFARSVSEDYGRAPGPSYLRDANSCPAVMPMLLQHFRKQLADPITVVEVRLKDGRAQVVLSSRTMSASHIFLMRQGGSWKIQELLAQPLP